ncbi:MAG: hypothetical protein ACXVNR_01635 [Bacteroidia bacterium]
MKRKLKILTLSGMVILSSLGFANNEPNKKQTAVCLKVSGKICDKKSKPTEKITVYLIKENEIIDSLKVRINAIFSFPLEKNQEYSIKVVHQGHADRLVYISTWLPKKVSENTLFEFHFDLIPFKPDESTSKEALDFPVALIYYHTDKGCFDYNKKYTSYIKKELNQQAFRE